MRNLLLSLILLPSVFITGPLMASSGGIQLQTAHPDLSDKASLQRGAKYFMNYCSSCHSLRYIRYEQIAEGIGLVDKNGKVNEALVKENLIFSDAKITDPVLTAMSKEQAKQSFGVVPPDLTLVSRVRGVNWLYTYFQSFYKDPARPLGTNNLLFPDVAMPNVFEPLQGVQIPLFHTEKVKTEAEGDKEVKTIVALEMASPGSMTPTQFEQMANDIVTFLDFVGEPKKIDRMRTGVWVLLFLIIFLIVAYLLKKEYWRDIH